MSGATIFALSSGAPPAAIAVVRVSGADAGRALRLLHGRLPPPRRATLGWLRAQASGERLDRALLLWLPGPKTATGEDLAELHLHGGRAVTQAVLDELATIDGLRAAQPGEFTRRALANGVIDLAQAEGLADLLAAETQSQRRNAQQLAGGVLSRRVAEWQTQILALSARVEASLDFADEDDVPADLAGVAPDATALASAIEQLLAGGVAERLRDGIRVVLAGPPNAGKSTLLNGIAGRAAAITAPTPGTTRDLIEVPISIDGVPFVFVDTAGLRECGDDAIEQAGISLARSAVEGADILLWLGTVREAPFHDRRLIVHGRCDLPGRSQPSPGADLAVSALSGTGLDLLSERVRTLAADMLPGETEIALNRRQRTMLLDCVISLTAAALTTDPLLIAEELRLARAALDRLTGTAGPEDMLDALFSRFCVGK